MLKIGLQVVALAGVSLFCGAVFADSTLSTPTYLGDRSQNPEQETYASVVTANSERVLGFVGPARPVGKETGDPEDDTVAYQPIPNISAGGRLSLQTDD